MKKKKKKNTHYKDLNLQIPGAKTNPLIELKFLQTK